MVTNSLTRPRREETGVRWEADSRPRARSLMRDKPGFDRCWAGSSAGIRQRRGSGAIHCFWVGRTTASGMSGSIVGLPTAQTIQRIPPKKPPRKGATRLFEISRYRQANAKSKNDKVINVGPGTCPLNFGRRKGGHLVGLPRADPNRALQGPSGSSCGWREQFKTRPLCASYRQV
jgi:hypothetical protein